MNEVDNHASAGSLTGLNKNQEVFTGVCREVKSENEFANFNDCITENLNFENEQSCYDYIKDCGLLSNDFSATSLSSDRKDVVKNSEYVANLCPRKRPERHLDNCSTPESIDATKVREQQMTGSGVNNIKLKSKTTDSNIEKSFNESLLNCSSKTSQVNLSAESFTVRADVEKEIKNAPSELDKNPLAFAKQSNPALNNSIPSSTSLDDKKITEVKTKSQVNDNMPTKTFFDPKRIFADWHKPENSRNVRQSCTENANVEENRGNKVSAKDKTSMENEVKEGSKNDINLPYENNEKVSSTFDEKFIKSSKLSNLAEDSSTTDRCTDRLRESFNSSLHEHLSSRSESDPVNSTTNKTNADSFLNSNNNGKPSKSNKENHSRIKPNINSKNESKRTGAQKNVHPGNSCDKSNADGESMAKSNNIPELNPDSSASTSEPTTKSAKKPFWEKADTSKFRLPNGKPKLPKSKHKSKNNQKSGSTSEKSEESFHIRQQLAFMEKFEFLEKTKTFLGYWMKTLWDIMWNCTKLTVGIVVVELTWILNSAWGLILKISAPCLRWYRRRKHGAGEETGGEGNDEGTGRTYYGHQYLAENINLPETGDEAMKRLMSGHGKDAYSILGLKPDCTDEEIKRYYRRQAILVHPDKNKDAGADEAFKILNQAFELIGDPEQRKEYDAQAAKQREADVAMDMFSDMLTKLQTTMKEAMDMIPCMGCSGKHKRVLVDRTLEAARYCSQCSTFHSAKEGDVWAESTVLGFLWNYYACMNNQVYNITKWASCQFSSSNPNGRKPAKHSVESFKSLPSNAHLVTMRIQTGNRNPPPGPPHRTSTGNPDIDDLLNTMFRGARGRPGDFNQFGSQTNRQTSATEGTRQKKKKKRR